LGQLRIVEGEEKRKEYLGSAVAFLGFARKDAFLAECLYMRVLECASQLDNQVSPPES
jgi:hypothetical protein